MISNLDRNQIIIIQCSLSKAPGDRERSIYKICGFTSKEVADQYISVILMFTEGVEFTYRLLGIHEQIQGEEIIDQIPGSIPLFERVPSLDVIGGHRELIYNGLGL